MRMRPVVVVFTKNRCLEVLTNHPTHPFTNSCSFRGASSSTSKVGVGRGIVSFLGKGKYWLGGVAVSFIDCPRFHEKTWSGFWVERWSFFLLPWQITIFGKIYWIQISSANSELLRCSNGLIRDRPIRIYFISPQYTSVARLFLLSQSGGFYHFYPIHFDKTENDAWSLLLLG